MAELPFKGALATPCLPTAASALKTVSDEPIAAMYAGLVASRGDYVTLMDADLQDPPFMLKEMYHYIKEENFFVVIVVKDFLFFVHKNKMHYFFLRIKFIFWNI